MKCYKMNRGGDCYEAAYRLLTSTEFMMRNPMLVHGIVGGFEFKGKFVPQHGHAWIEYSEEGMMGPNTYLQTIAVDRSNGNDAQMPVELYYYFGCVRDDQVRKYSVEDAMKMICREQHYGPWEQELINIEDKSLKETSYGE